MLFSVIAILSSKSLFANMNLFCIKSITKAPEVQHLSFSQLVFATSRYASLLPIIIKLRKFSGMWITEQRTDVKWHPLTIQPKGNVFENSFIIIYVSQCRWQQLCRVANRDSNPNCSLSESQMGFWWNRGFTSCLTWTFKNTWSILRSSISYSSFFKLMRWVNITTGQIKWYTVRATVNQPLLTQEYAANLPDRRQGAFEFFLPRVTIELLSLHCGPPYNDWKLSHSNLSIQCSYDRVFSLCDFRIWGCLPWCLNMIGSKSFKGGYREPLELAKRKVQELLESSVMGWL